VREKELQGLFRWELQWI